MGELAKEIHTVTPCDISGDYDKKPEKMIEKGDVVDVNEVYQ